MKRIIFAATILLALLVVSPVFFLAYKADQRAEAKAKAADDYTSAMAGVHYAEGYYDATMANRSF